MFERRLRASSIPGALSPWRYDASFSRWLGGDARAFRELTAEMSGAAPGEAVLDLGCGTGELAMSLCRRVGPSGSVAGIDVSAALVAGARRKAKRAGLTIDFRVASIDQLPFADASVDLVVSSLVMHHLAPEVLRRAVHEIRRVLKPGGRVFVLDFVSLDQAGDGHHSANPGHRGLATAHTPEHAQERGHSRRRGKLHDHRPILVGLLAEAGMASACATPVELGRRLEVTRCRLAT